MADKDYGGWQVKKLALNNTETTRYFYEREIWWVAIGHNVGVEEDGKMPNFARPVLIYKKYSQSPFYGLPMSTTRKTGKYYYPVNALGVEDKILLTQMRAFDAKRLINKVGVLPTEDYSEVRKRLIEIL